MRLRVGNVVLSFVGTIQAKGESEGVTRREKQDERENVVAGRKRQLQAQLIAQMRRAFLDC